MNTSLSFTSWNYAYGSEVFDVDDLDNIHITAKYNLNSCHLLFDSSNILIFSIMPKAEEDASYFLPLYYKRLFPFNPYYRWLSYGRRNYLENREISFTLADDIYVRYNSFANRQELMESIQKRNPVKIDIGAVYNGKPSQRNTTTLTPMEREIVFDIDMTDYDEVRNCCSGADICTKCWKFMVVAVKILDAALRDDFGFENILWVFSGRRGIHCWVCDETARKLDTLGRSAIAEYLNIIKGGAGRAKKVSLPREQIHHSVLRALDICESHFVDICLIDQDILATEEKVVEFIKFIPEVEDREEFKKAILVEKDSRKRWDAFSRHWAYLKNSGNLKKSMKNLVEEIKLHYLYPRLDINVTKGMNHLLKSPFCVHPKTGKISVPFNPKSVEKFNPDTVPTVQSLAVEINKYDEGTEETDRTNVKDYKKTNMLKSVVVFEEFVRKLESSWKGQKIEASDKAMTF